MFVAKDYEIKLWIRLHSYLAGRFSRKDFLRKFCTENGLDYKLKKGHKYCLPEKYLIEDKEISFLSGIRDKLILSFYDDYCEAQNKNLSQQEKIKEDIEIQKGVIETCRKRLLKNQALSKNAKAPIDQIHFSNVVSNLKTRLRNEKQSKAYLDDELKRMELQRKANRRNWNKQVSIIEKLLDYRRKVFEKNISKLVRKKYKFSEFYSCFDGYSVEAKKAIEGELYE